MKNLLILVLFGFFQIFNSTTGNASELTYELGVTADVANSPISGTVLAADTDEPLIGVSVTIQGTNVGTITDSDGQYTLDIPSDIQGSVTLVYSYIGYSSITRTVDLLDEGVVINVNLAVSSTALNEVVISANKRTQTVMEVPSSVQSLSGRELAKVGYRDLVEAIELVPGATESVANSVGQRQYQIRGVPQISGDATVGYYLDDAAFNIYGTIFAPVSRTFDINRVEVLRGPQSTLYGNGAMGGVIKFIPNKPNLKKFEGEVVLGANSQKDGDGGYFGDIMLDLPIIKDKLGIRFSNSYQKVGGFVDLEDGSQENINDGNVSQLRGILLYKPTNDLEFEVSYQSNTAEQNAGFYVGDPETRVTFFDPRDELNNDFEWLTGTVRYNFKNFASLTSSTNTINANQQNTLYLEFPGIGEVFADTKSDNKALNHETRLVSNTDGPFQWLAGFYYLDSESNQTTLTEPMLIPADPDIFSSTQTSFFGEVSYSFLNDKLKALVGARTFSDDRSVLEGGVTELSDTFTSFNPRFNLSYQPNSTSNFFINAAKGFRSGSFNGSVIIQFHEAAGLPIQQAIGSDELWSYEVGLKKIWADAGVSLELSAYYQDWSNMRNLVADPIGGFAADYSVGDAEIPGVDISLGYSPEGVSGLSFQGVVNFNGAQFKSIIPDVADFFEQSAGERLQLVPASTFSFVTNYSFGLGQSGWRGNTLFSLSHVSEQLGFGPDSTGDAQTQARIRIGIQNDKFDIVLFGNNILDESGPIFIQSTNPAQILNYVPSPTSYGLQVGYRF